MYRSDRRRVEPRAADREHDVDDGIEHEVDLRLAVAAALGREDDRAHVVDRDRPSVAEVARELVGEPIHLAHPVAERERAHPIEALALGSSEAVRDHLSGGTDFAEPRLAAVEPGGHLSLLGCERVLEALERGVDVGGGVSALLHREGGVPDPLG